MILSHVLLIVASFAAGIIASIAGGGAFITFPALMLTGLDPRAANITSTIALYPMQVSTGFSERRQAAGTPHLSFQSLLIISLVGGFIGAVLLLFTSAKSFAHFVPWLILLATLSFALGGLYKKTSGQDDSESKPDRLGKIGAGCAQFLISIYGGYFGGGIGLMMLASLSISGMKMRKAITTKNILAAAMNTSAVGVFLLSSDIYWFRAGLVAIAAISGGLVGLRFVDRIKESDLRVIIIAIGLALTIAMFWRTP